LGSSTRRIRRCIFGICAGGCNAVDGRKDKQDGGIIFLRRPWLEYSIVIPQTNAFCEPVASPNPGEHAAFGITK
jgi:hypothetical protein